MEGHGQRASPAQACPSSPTEPPERQQGRAGSSQVQGDTLDQSEINLDVIKRSKHSVCTNPS